jgi:phage terminase large subunit
LRNASESSERRFSYRAGIDRLGLWEHERSACAGSVSHFVGQWCYTVDPRDLSVWPFDPFPRQLEFLAWLQDRERRQESGLVEKSRDMGVTWLCCAYALHGWLFRPNFACGFGSRKLELVDRLGDLDSIIEKVRYMLYGLPRQLVPPGFRRKDHDNLARLVNPDNGSSVTGEGGDHIGRGGRKTLYFVDEAAFLERPDQVERSLSETTRVRVDVSTPNGPGNPFARKRFGGKVPVFTLHALDDPRKGPAWYAKRKTELDPVTFAQEVDIDYSASVEGICVPAAWVRAAVGLDLPESGPVVAGLDVAEDGPDRSVLVCRRGPVVRPPVDWGRLNTTQTAWRARDEAVLAGASAVNYDVVGVGAGVRGTWASADRLPFVPVAVNGGSTPTPTRWPDGRTSKEKFANLSAELWWLLRCRFERAYEYRELRTRHPAEEMISIPNHPQLIAELSSRLYFHTSVGKIALEDKKAMRRRGVKSPDFADALALSFLPPRGSAGVL